MRPLLAFETPTMLIKKSYLDADRFPHFPYHLQRYIHYLAKEQPDNRFLSFFQAAIDELKQYGPIVAFSHVNDHKTTPSFSVPIVFLPNIRDIALINITTSYFNARPEIKEVVQEVIKNLVRNYTKLLRKVRVVGYVPLRLIEEPRFFVNFIFFHFYLRQFNILSMYNMMHLPHLALIVHRAFSTAGFYYDENIADTVFRHINLRSATTMKIEDGLASPFSRFDKSLLGHVIYSIGASVADRERSESSAKSAIDYLLSYGLDRKIISPDVLTVSDRPEVYELPPDNTFTRIPILYRYQARKDIVKLIDISEYRPNVIFAVTQEGEITNYDVYRLYITQVLLHQFTSEEIPYDVLPDIEAEVERSIRLLPHNSVVERNFKSETEFVDEKATRLLRRGMDIKLQPLLTS